MNNRTKKQKNIRLGVSLLVTSTLVGVFTDFRSRAGETQGSNERMKSSHAVFPKPPLPPLPRAGGRVARHRDFLGGRLLSSDRLQRGHRHMDGLAVPPAGQRGGRGAGDGEIRIAGADESRERAGNHDQRADATGRQIGRV